MSAEAERRLQDDIRFLESVNVWHLVNLRSSNPHALYNATYPDRLDLINPTGMTQLGTYSTSTYNHLAPAYLEGQKYLSSGSNPVSNGASVHSSVGVTTPPISAGIGTSLPYPDLIVQAHAKEMSPRQVSQRSVVTNEKQYEGPEVLPKYNIVENRDFSPVIQNSLPLKETPRLKHLSLLPKEPEDYDADENSLGCATPDGKKAVSFTADTKFVSMENRDMESPFWKAFTERRRLRRIHRQKKQLNAQIASVSYQPSLLEIVKSAFSKNTRDNNGNCTKRKHHHHQSQKGEVLVYDNSSQIPESYTTQYVYSVPNSRSQKLLQMITCQCCSPDSSC